MPNSKSPNHQSAQPCSPQAQQTQVVDAQLFDNQVCFPLYSAANAVTRAYRPLLDAIDLTYLQYMVMMLLWQHKQMNVKELGEQMYLDSGTLTPLLKRLEAKGFVERRRSELDERVRLISITEAGLELKFKAQSVPGELACKADMSPEQAMELKRLCQTLLANLGS